MDNLKYEQATTFSEYEHATRLSGKLINSEGAFVSVLGTKECEIIVKALNNFYANGDE
jgi:hypothetical protein